MVLWRLESTDTIVAKSLNLLAATCALFSANLPPQQPTRHVRWAPSLELQSLADIDRRLTMLFADPVPVTKGAHEATVTNCTECLEYTKEGFTAKSDRELRRLKSMGVDCLALVALKGAVPARRSYLDGFSLDSQAVKYLPPTLGLVLSQDDLKKVSAAESRGTSWKEYEPNLKVESENQDRASIENQTALTRLQTYARGDFNGDGIEDLLLRVDNLSKQGSYSNSRLLLLTRTSTYGKLRLVKEYK
jgi:hypothetical protein